MIGIANLSNESTLFPYRVQATKYSRFFYIHRRQLLAAFKQMTMMDEHACRAAIKMEHQKHVNSLKEDLQRRETMARKSAERGSGGQSFASLEEEDDDDDDVDEKLWALRARNSADGKPSHHVHRGLPYDETMPLMTQCVMASHALHRVTGEALEELKELRRMTHVIPQLLQNAKVNASGGYGGRRRSVLNPGAAGGRPQQRRRCSILNRMSTFVRGDDDSNPSTPTGSFFGRRSQGDRASQGERTSQGDRDASASYASNRLSGVDGDSGGGAKGGGSASSGGTGVGANSSGGGGSSVSGERDSSPTQKKMGFGFFSSRSQTGPRNVMERPGTSLFGNGDGERKHFWC